MDIVADTFIFQQGLLFNYWISFCEESNGWNLCWSYGFDSCSENKHCMIITDIIDIATMRSILEKDLAKTISRDVNSWNKNHPLVQINNEINL